MAEPEGITAKGLHHIQEASAKESSRLFVGAAPSKSPNLTKEFS
jgi:hypothetical protein